MANGLCAGNAMCEGPGPARLLLCSVTESLSRCPVLAGGYLPCSLSSARYKASIDDSTSSGTALTYLLALMSYTLCKDTDL